MKNKNRLTIKQGNDTFTALIKEEGRQLNVSVFKQGEKSPLFGTNFSGENSYFEAVEWVHGKVKSYCIELHEAQTEDLIKELYYRIYEPRSRAKIETFVRMCLGDDFGVELPDTSSLVDKMKFDYFIENFKTITQEQLEA